MCDIEQTTKADNRSQNMSRAKTQRGKNFLVFCDRKSGNKSRTNTQQRIAVRSEPFNL